VGAICPRCLKPFDVFAPRLPVLLVLEGLTDFEPVDLTAEPAFAELLFFGVLPDLEPAAFDPLFVAPDFAAAEECVER
jgi:hypothetical protein